VKKEGFLPHQRKGKKERRSFFYVHGYTLATHEGEGAGGGGGKFSRGKGEMTLTTKTLGLARSRKKVQDGGSLLSLEKKEEERKDRPRLKSEAHPFYGNDNRT